MRAQRWVYVMLVVIGVALGIAIAGVPSGHHDLPLHPLSSTTTTVSETTASSLP